MAEGVTVVAGIPIPSTSPVFLAVVGFHVLVGLACVATGAVATLSRKRRGRLSDLGTIYFWGLVAVFASSAGLATVRRAEDYPLFVLAALAMAGAWLGRRAMRTQKRPATSAFASAWSDDLANFASSRRGVRPGRHIDIGKFKSKSLASQVSRSCRAIA